MPCPNATQATPAAAARAGGCRQKTQVEPASAWRRQAARQRRPALVSNSVADSFLVMAPSMQKVAARRCSGLPGGPQTTTGLEMTNVAGSP